VSDIGGVLEIFTVFFSLIASKYAKVRLWAMISSRLYYLNSTIREEIYGDKPLTRDELGKKRLIRNAGG
jgi:hypothetical protein